MMSADSERFDPPKNSEAFESLCLELWKDIWGYSGAQKNGRNGQPQAGVDVYGRHDGKWIGVQCKTKDGLRRSRLTIRELEQEVGEARTFEPKLASFVLATTGLADAKIQQRARELTQQHADMGLFSVEVWFWEKIWHEIYHREELLRRIGPVYWPQTWRLIEERSKAIPHKEWTALTSSANEQISRAAQKWLDTECAPFVVPSLDRYRVSNERSALTAPSREWQPLDKSEFDKIVLGRLPRSANRLRIVGDSGIGKTSLLYYCELRIAAGNDGYVPLRIDGLSGYNWTLSREEVFRWMIERVLHRYLPAELEPNEAVMWLSYLAAHRKIVFLLDALDQTDQQLNEAGLRTFLQSSDVVGCPVIMTLRPEVKGSVVFSAANWDTVQARGFIEETQRKQFLGDVAQDLLTQYMEEWLVPESYERKQQWVDLLEVPLLLKMLRDLSYAQKEKSSETSLAHLRNRHAVYREALAHLVGKGLETTKATQFRRTLYDAAEVDDRLMNIAWATVAQGGGNFSATLEGKAFRKLRNDCRSEGDVLRALQQVHVIARYSILDRYDNAGLAWRHRSFAEYFAGKHLAQADAHAQGIVAERHGRDPRWQWVFRFALSEIDTENRRTQTVDDQLARSLIQYGNPFVVFDAIKWDGITLPDHLHTLCRWLVHRDWDVHDYRDAWKEPDPPRFDDRWIEILESVFEREHRNSRCLHPAWQLVENSCEPWAETVRERFLSEFRRMLADTECMEYSVARTLADAESFARCPLDRVHDGRPFHMGSLLKEQVEGYAETPQHEVRITPFFLQRTPVSNVQFELFDPSHRLRRDDFSAGESNPAVWVSWYMAELFCVWLGQDYRLPTEAEWEYAARAGTTMRYWWGDQPEPTKCHSSESNIQATLLPDASRANPWGLIDILGNVYEWCLDRAREYTEAAQIDPLGPCEQGSYRAFRGGGWHDGAVLCRSAYRSGYPPVRRACFLGFRLARRRVLPMCKSTGHIVGLTLVGKDARGEHRRMTTNGQSKRLPSIRN